ncbi:hypothetical protein GUITHDRAFT_106597 [Guillardia theta CCMP2712]|uniref:Uncharacterized protein n=1 Tax=Guillardia theta (strain CCMP2712) TaxID=905079 RepID=L1JHN4_GUITC|nr:hypothetical protein GUITHDRAFT_106597 [Guillardia theta CCMP2712]EKX47610.1 hypothetical protein GUITHDRAFT_106597 [Guillardia theta CCMP2712]|eukprot:XP_005834590.1 hypothetical protein GUITHDRAFT_106597 [Guillardia theta CCMP2712]
MSIFKFMVLAAIAATAMAAPRYKRVGCYRDADMGGGERVIPSLEHTDARLNDNYRFRRAPINSCAQVAWDRKLPGFVLQASARAVAFLYPFPLTRRPFGQDGGWCGGSENMLTRYNMFGEAENMSPPYDCVNGRGGLWSNDVYIFTEREAEKEEI